MQQLEALAREAAALGGGSGGGGTERVITIHPLRADEAEVGRVMQICNACRYCEGHGTGTPRYGAR